MAEYTINCPSCGIELTFEDGDVGALAECPGCGAEMTLERPGEERGVEVESVQLPEHMKANKAVAGRTCPSCGGAIEFGDPVFNCGECGISMHETCWERHGGCSTPQCASGPKPLSLKRDAPADVTPLRNAPPVQSEQVSEDDLKECQFCGEKIRKRARKCPYCKEYVDGRKKSTSRAASRGSGDYGDETLTGGEIALGVLCSGIACIVAIVWIVQGKKKGWKLLLIAIIVQIIFGAIRALGSM